MVRFQTDGHKPAIGCRSLNTNSEEFHNTPALALQSLLVKKELSPTGPVLRQDIEDVLESLVLGELLQDSRYQRIRRVQRKISFADDPFYGQSDFFTRFHSDPERLTACS